MHLVILLTDFGRAVSAPPPISALAGAGRGGCVKQLPIIILGEESLFENNLLEIRSAPQNNVYHATSYMRLIHI